MHRADTPIVCRRFRHFIQTIPQEEMVNTVVEVNPQSIIDANTPLPAQPPLFSTVWSAMFEALAMNESDKMLMCSNFRNITSDLVSMPPGCDIPDALRHRLTFSKKIKTLVSMWEVYQTSNETEMFANVSIGGLTGGLLSCYMDKDIKSVYNKHTVGTETRVRNDVVHSLRELATRALLRCEFKTDEEDMDDGEDQLVKSLRPNTMVYQHDNTLFALVGAGKNLRLLKITVKGGGVTRSGVPYTGTEFITIPVWTGTLGTIASFVEFATALYRCALVMRQWPVVCVNVPSVPSGDIVRRFPGEGATGEGAIKARLRFTTRHVYKARDKSAAVREDNWECIKEVYAAKIEGVVSGDTMEGSWEGSKGDTHWIEVMDLHIPYRGNERFFPSEHLKGDISHALDGLHEAGYAHCDVRLDNVVVSVPEGAACVGQDPKWDWESETRPKFLLCDLEYVSRKGDMVGPKHGQHLARFPEGKDEMTGEDLDAYQLSMLMSGA